ncbi:MAG: hypothetical protein HYU69_09635, partial [Bacteroidetes bacterium]|nr:hypothetical protein [Bacteroidota bacterium]
MKPCYLFLLVIVNNLYAHAYHQTVDLNVRMKDDMIDKHVFGFQENKGQMKDDHGNPAPYVLFKTVFSNLNIWITTSGLTYEFLKLGENIDDSDRDGSNEMNTENSDEKVNGEWSRVDMVLKGASIKEENIFTEGDITEGVVNYYLANCPGGIHNVRTYTKITVKEAYKGIDWVLYTLKDGAIKYDFVVHPYADPNQIKLIYEGSGRLTLSSNEIYFENKLGHVTDGKLLCYQGNESNSIVANFVIKKNESPLFMGADNLIDPNEKLGHNPVYNKANSSNIFSYEISIKINRFNSSRILTIDPQLVLGTYFGGSSYDIPYS